MDLQLSGKVVLITGAGRGVGRGVARRFAEEGAKVAVNDFHERRAERVVRELREAGAQAEMVVADITVQEQVCAMVKRVEDTLGPVDVLVNNAGIPTTEPGVQPQSGWQEFVASEPTAWRRVIELNLYGSMYCAHRVLPQMIAQRSGKIISVMSEAGRVGEAKLAAYSGAKAGLLGFSKALAREVGKHCINVNVVALGAVDAKELDYERLDEATQARLSSLFKAYPIGRGLRRLSRADDIANGIVFLASQRAEYITGQVLGLSGGFAMP